MKHTTIPRLAVALLTSLAAAGPGRALAAQYRRAPVMPMTAFAPPAAPLSVAPALHIPSVFMMEGSKDLARMASAVDGLTPEGRARLLSEGSLMLSHGPIVGMILPRSSQALLLPKRYRADGALLSTSGEAATRKAPSLKLFYEAMMELPAREFRSLESSYSTADRLFNGRSTRYSNTGFFEQISLPDAELLETREPNRHEIQVWNKRTSRLERLPIARRFHYSTLMTDDFPARGQVLAKLNPHSERDPRLALLKPFSGQVQVMPANARGVPLDEAKLSRGKRHLLFLRHNGAIDPAPTHLVWHEIRTGKERRVRLSQKTTHPSLESLSPDGRYVTILDIVNPHLLYRVKVDARTGKVIWRRRAHPKPYEKHPQEK